MKSVFDGLLSSLTVKIRTFGYCEVHPGWRLAFTSGQAATFHCCLSGAGRMLVGRNMVIDLRPETFVLIANGAAHAFEGTGVVSRHVDGDTKPATGTLPLHRLQAGEGSDDPLVVACGEVAVGAAGREFLFDPLGMAISTDDLEPPHARRAIEQLLHELESPRPGSSAIADALLKLCLLLLLRMQNEKGKYKEWLLSIPAHEGFERALTTMIEHPAKPFSLDELAATAGMSRSAFTRLFNATLGQSPGDFLRDLRLHQAARLLETTDRQIDRIAKAVGYDSRSHFSRLFKEKFGHDPTAFRRLK